MGSSYWVRLFRSVVPYVLFYLLLCIPWGGWSLPYGWLIPLPVLVIGLLKELPGARYELRELSIHESDVTIRYVEYDREHAAVVLRGTLRATMQRDPTTIYRKYYLELVGPGVRVRQYERGSWTEARMKEVIAQFARTEA